jgi:hypothetical protein
VVCAVDASSMPATLRAPSPFCATIILSVFGAAACERVVPASVKAA